ncbi:MAG TPA: PstS family phosphate ABC transporter substrate-binding protein, partial [Rhodothermales bacterium]|nr:PstS family phosphate ABC transporter substrate-binding protein [Rhodothermales bacterium]
ILIDGSSTVYPISEAVAEEYIRAHRGVRVTVGVSGTGSGFAKFARGETDISDASRPINPTEAQAAAQNGIQFIELPVAYDGVSIVVNPQNDWVDCLTVDELKRLWEPSSQITNWNQIRPTFPNQPIHLYGPSPSDGTYDYFTEAIVGHQGASRSEFTASEDDNVLVQGIAGDPNSLGYFGYAYYENNRDKLKVLGIDDGDPSNGEGCIKPSPETIQSNQYQPLARPLFLYVNASKADSTVMQSFINFYLENAGVLAPDVGYVALSDQAYQLAKERYQKRTTGTLFESGATTGVTLEDLYRRESGSMGDTDSTAAQADSATQAVQP